MIDEMDSTLTPNCHRFLIQLTEPIYRKLGWETIPNESHNDTMLRPLIIRTLGKCSFQEVVDESLKRFNKHHESSGDGTHILPADIRAAVYATVLKHGDEVNLAKIMDVS